jgi:hypothetical protein
VSNAASLPLGDAYSALAHFKVHVVFRTLRNGEAAQKHLKEAIAARKRVLNRVKHQPSSQLSDLDEQAYEQLVPFLLW